MNAVFEFFAMGGYALYVWLAYAAVAGVLIIKFIMAYRQKRRVIRQINCYKQRQAHESHT